MFDERPKWGYARTIPEEGTMKKLHVADPLKFGGRMSGLLAFIVTFIVASHPVSRHVVWSNLYAAFCGLWIYGTAKWHVWSRYA